jgi:hypothetical protein
MFTRTRGQIGATGLNAAGLNRAQQVSSIGGTSVNAILLHHRDDVRLVGQAKEQRLPAIGDGQASPDLRTLLFLFDQARPATRTK